MYSHSYSSSLRITCDNSLPTISHLAVLLFKKFHSCTHGINDLACCQLLTEIGVGAFDGSTVAFIIGHDNKRFAGGRISIDGMHHEHSHITGSIADTKVARSLGIVGDSDMTTDEEVLGIDIRLWPSDEGCQTNGVAKSIVGAIAIGVGLCLLPFADSCGIDPDKCTLTQFDNCANIIVPDGIGCVVRDNILSCIIRRTASCQNNGKQYKDGLLNSNQCGR